MKIVAITDKKGSAIDRLARMNEVRLPHMHYIVCPLHPKRPDAVEVEQLRQAIQGADLIHFEYWKSAMKARELFPEIASIPSVLTHHNEHNINDDSKNHWAWKDVSWTHHVAKNGWQKKELKKLHIDATLIPHAIVFENLSYIDKLTTEKVVGYVGQVKKVKGVREIAEACSQLGYKLLLVGSVSEADYFAELMEKYGETIITPIPGALHAPDKMLGAQYHKMRAYCANSDDGTESGTMPILEAMASGIPVVTRKIGLVRDCGEHKKNMWVRDGHYTDIEDLKAGLRMVVENEDIANDMREKAWRSVRQYHPDRQAREFERLFRKILFPNQPSVSVIMPTCGRNEQVIANIEHLRNQTYKNFEVVICDDNAGMDSALLEDKVLHVVNTPFPVKFVSTDKQSDGYGLAKARNLGVIEATGDILVFCDDRLLMHPGAIEAFVKAVHENGKVWAWGSKGVFKTFVENFSAVTRRHLIDGGMFNERIDRYGGMTQEISGRFSAQGFSFQFVPQALCEPAFGTHSRSKHREDIIASKIQLYKMGLQ